MKLTDVLENLNSFEKNAFLKIIDSLINENPENQAKIEKIISNTKDLKTTDHLNVSKVFHLLEKEYINYIKNEFTNVSNQLDIVIDIIMRDGNSIINYEWFSKLYEQEVKKIKHKVNSINKTIDDESNKYYKIYKNCVNTAFKNDAENNQDFKVTKDELSILITLAQSLNLSQEEVKLINYTVLPLDKKPTDDLINELKNIGVIFYSRKLNTIYIADEIVFLLRKVRGKDVADKYLRRILNQLKPSELNLICRSHNLDWKIDQEEKIENILYENIPVKKILSEEIFKDDINLSDRKKYINEIALEKLKIPEIKGQTIEEKIDSIINFFNRIETDEKVGISIDGYENLIRDLSVENKSIIKKVKSTFQLSDEIEITANSLLKFNIKPKDILYLFNNEEIKSFCSTKGVSTRGDEIQNILSSYKDVDNILIENYQTIGNRDINALKENGIKIKEGDLGIQFENITSKILKLLGFNVDDEIKKEINTKKDKTDLILKINENDIIIIECKTSKDKFYNKFSSVSRQLKSYKELASKNGYNVIKSILIAPEFSDDFISDCELEYELNLSLIKASTLYNILVGFKNNKLDALPYNLFMRDVLIQEERVLKAITK